jgi:amphiphysin
MVTSQLNTASEFATLYDPIAGASDGHGGRSQPTPELQLTRTFNLRTAFEGAKNDIIADISAFESHVIKPGSDARDFIQPIRKTIKRREAKRLDFEKCQEKARKLQRKPGKSAKEDAQMHKVEEELAHLSEVESYVDLFTHDRRRFES